MKLVFGNWGKGQHYNVKLCPGSDNVFQIKDKDNDKMFLFADIVGGVIQLGEKEDTAK